MPDPDPPRHTRRLRLSNFCFGECAVLSSSLVQAVQNPQVSGAGAGGAGEGAAGGVHGMSTGRRRREDGLADSDDDAGNDS